MHYEGYRSVLKIVAAALSALDANEPDSVMSSRLSLSGLKPDSRNRPRFRGIDHRECPYLHANAAFLIELPGANAAFGNSFGASPDQPVLALCFAAFFVSNLTQLSIHLFSGSKPTAQVSPMDLSENGRSGSISITGQEDINDRRPRLDARSSSMHDDSNLTAGSVYAPCAARLVHSSTGTQFRIEVAGSQL